jgi:hypothetical protein
LNNTFKHYSNASIDLTIPILITKYNTTPYIGDNTMISKQVYDRLYKNLTDFVIWYGIITIFWPEHLGSYTVI